ncbi:MAG: hypothetical protein U9Q74_08080 [Gemmatimonadota bacterium]|nr:hypothetical protein [Gemmatimonadota bacterium]
MTEARRRLDSWKIIAAYLDRDERTVRRWERELALPVRRLPGARGHTVYAWADEIDAWLASGTARDAPPGGTTPAATTPVEAAPAEPTATPLPPRRVIRRSALWLTAAGAVLVIAGTARWGLARIAPGGPLRIDASPTGIAAFDSAGALAWRWPFPAGARTVLPTDDVPDVARFATGSDPAAYAATSFSVRVADQHTEGGRVLRFTPAGRLEAQFAFDDTVSLGGRPFGPPWAITTFALSDAAGTRRIAVAAHHYLWNASIVVILDARLRRQGTFVHNGWIEGLRWVAADRLLLAGFSNTRDAATVMLLAVPPDGAIAGQGPETPGSAGWCEACGTARPLKAVSLPRTEVNRATGSPFNRARLQVLGDRVIVRTIEVPGTGAQSTADAIYEFSPALDLVSHSFSDAYQERRAELARRRAMPADPPAYGEWTATTGWRTVSIR